MSTKVSIVDDDEVSRSLWAEWIDHAPGFSCRQHYGSAEQAEAPLLQDRPYVVLMDINLPGRSGIECVRRLKPQAPEMQFVMLTVYGDADHVFDALAEAQRLSGREQEILQLLARGRQNKEIVTELGISPSTVATHIRRIYEKLHVHSRAEAVGKFATLANR